MIANTENGIFGVYSSLPDALAKKERIAVGKRSEIHDGDAVIYCTLGNTTEEYSVSIGFLIEEFHGNGDRRKAP